MNKLLFMLPQLKNVHINISLLKKQYKGGINKEEHGKLSAVMEMFFPLTSWDYMNV